MAVQQTSLDSYVQLRMEKKLAPIQKRIFAFITANPRCTDREIVRYTGYTINCVCGRRHELVKLGLIREDGKKYDEQTNREVIAWREV